MSADGALRQSQDSRIAQLRVPPQSVEAEQAVLGGMMLSPGALNKVRDRLGETSFYRRDHQLIYRAICEMDDAQKPFDAVTLGDWFCAQGLAELVAGGAYLVELASTTPSAANISAYADIVRDKAALRDLITLGTALVNQGFEPEGKTPGELLDGAVRQALLMSQASTPGGLRPMHGVMSLTFADLVERHASAEPIGMQSPWGNVNDILLGADPGDLIVVAARPSMGKTALALQWAEWAACDKGKNVAIFSMEMMAKQLGMRLVSKRARIDSRAMRNAHDLSDEDWAAINDAIKYLGRLPIAIDDGANLTAPKLRARAMRMHAKRPLGLIVVDYLQLLDTHGAESREQGISAASRMLKNLGKELGCPVIALSQLNRSLETRTNKRPIMADLRESGAIEQDADVIIFIYRDDYYEKELSNAPGLVEIIVGKQRNGPTGTAYLKSELQYSTLLDTEQRPQKSEAAKKAGGLRRGKTPVPDHAAAAAGDRS